MGIGLGSGCAAVLDAVLETVDDIRPGCRNLVNERGNLLQLEYGYLKDVADSKPSGSDRCSTLSHRSRR